ncbi:MAG: hypothetical protein IKV97_05950 [Clostridia bacterium]|nr:hypothetical protein [Clostridia bacterium]
MTERTKKIREIYKNCPVAKENRPFYYSGDRWLSLGFLEGWLENETALTTKLRRSLSEAHELDCAEPIIDDCELICGKVYFPKYSPEEQARFDELAKAFRMSPTAKSTEVCRARADHICLDFEKLLRVGVNGAIDEIKEKRRKLDLSSQNSLYSFEVYEKKEFYDCCIIELEAVLRLAKRYSEKALELSKKAAEPRKSELIKISENLEKVPAGPAETFYQAVQSVHFYLFNMFGLYPLGRPDRYLLPYYENDIKNGVLTKEFAQELIDNLCLGVSGYVFSRAACGFIVGGSDGYGNLIENDLTYMFLTALNHIKMPDPNGALAVNEKTSKDCLAYAAHIIKDGTTHPAIYNDNAIIRGLCGYGIPREDACEYIHTTCAEMSICGKSRMYTTSFTVNMPGVLLELLQSGIPNNFEELLERYFEKLEFVTKNGNENYVMRLMEAGRNGHQPMRASCFVNDCISAGRDVYSGGAKYSYMQPIFIGFSNLCDSLFAINTLVFKEKKLTLEDFFEIVKSDYKNSEDLRIYIINKLPHYGNDSGEIDDFAHSLYLKLEELFDKKELSAGRFCMPGTFSYVNHASHGAVTGATFDGRKSGMSLSDGCCPVQGYDRSGPTAMINSLTGWDQGRFMGGMVVNVKFSKSAFDDNKINVFLGLVNTFTERGGIEMQFNCVDRETLIDARLHPDSHRDLVVRIGGYSHYFTDLMPCLQQEIIDRTQY